MADTTFLCANKCGHYGNPKTLNLCSKCYVLRPHPVFSFAVFPTQNGVVPSDDSNVTAPVGNKTAPCGPSRCSACKKRVGLTGFDCRCGAKYCGAHRYPETHSCAFDFKAVGKEAIEKANPLIKADKMENRL